MDASIKPVSPVVSFCGVAFTVKTRPVDNLVVWKALQLAQPGDVLWSSPRGACAHSTWGDLTSRVGAARGLAAMVTDGAVRDLDGIAEAGLPVFAAAVTPNSPQKDGPGEINVPIACGGQVVHPGDILVGDRDGVVVVPRIPTRRGADRAGTHPVLRDSAAGGDCPRRFLPARARSATGRARRGVRRCSRRCPVIGIALLGAGYAARIQLACWREIPAPP